jgi:hypothetical protein
MAGFDYSGLTADDRELAKRTVVKIRQHLRRTSREIIDIGTDLIKVRAALGHGHFEAWLESEFGRGSDRTARNYMQAARCFGAKSEIVSVLPPATLYLLSAPSTPETITGRIVAELENGGQPDPKAIKAEVETARREAKEQARKEREQQLRAERLKGLKDPEKAERRRLEEEAEEQEEQKQAAVTAQKIIDEVGIGVVARVLDTDWRVHRALREMVEKATRQSAA